jgi:dTDP-glucose 4,6-dehydratase
MQKKIIITGGNGFIGTNLIIELLKDKNNKILNIDKFSYCSNLYLIKNKNINLKNANINLLNFTKLKKIILKFKPDLIYHLASLTHVDTSIHKPSSYYQNNVLGTLNLLTIIQQTKKILKKKFKFIYVGTDEVYGDLAFSSTKTFDENQPLAPNNPYSASKAASVLMVKAWYKNFGVRCIITNSVNNLGIFQYVEKFIPRSILLAKKFGLIEIYGKGKNVRSWIGAKEHARALIFLSNNGIIGQTYNIASNYKFKNIDLAKKIIKILKIKDINVKIKFVRDRMGHDKKYSINSNKLKKLGWKTNLNFDHELKNIVEWYLKEDNLKYFKNVNQNLNRK